MKAPADMESALAELGIEVYRANDDEVTCYCPEHYARVQKIDKHASWSVNRVTGLHNCFSCGFSGTFLTLVMDMLYPHDVFRAARWIRGFGFDLSRPAALPTNYAELEEVRAERTSPLLVPEVQLSMFDPDVPTWALEKRGISVEAARHFNLRWDATEEAWIIPVRLPTGELLGWQKKWERKRRFCNEPDDMKKSLSLFGYEVFPVGEPAIMVESPLDVARIYTVGWEGGLATYGASVSEVQMRLLLPITDELIVALDDDKDGRRAAEEIRAGKWKKGKLVGPVWANRFHTRFFHYGDTGAKDPGDTELMRPEDVTRGLYEAQHASLARLGTAEQIRERLDGVRRDSSSLSGRARRADARSRTDGVLRRRRDRQDPDVNRLGRGAGRRVR